MKRKKFANSKATEQQKKILKLLESGGEIYNILHDYNLTMEDIEYWCKTDFKFRDKYLKAIGITVDQYRFLKVFPYKLLNVAATCKAVRIHRSTYYRWVDKCDTFRQHLHDVSEGLKDDIESYILQRIFEKQETNLIIFYAKAKMRDRGW